MPSLSPFPILHRADDWIAIHKPAGWLVHRTGLDAHEPRVVLQSLRDQLGRLVYPVHRLDKGTSGVLVFGFSSQAAQLLATAFENRQVDKRYLAFVRGWPPAVCLVDHALRQADEPEGAPVQPAQTELHRRATLQIDEALDRYPSVRAALVEARPLTGRRHQIRRHLKHIAHPVIGDTTHGKGLHNRWWAGRTGVSRLWLHAWALGFDDPFGSGRLTIRSPLDEPWNADWQALLACQTWEPPGPGEAYCTMLEPGS